MSPHRRVLPPILACLMLLALAVTVSACGWSNDTNKAVEGESLQLGELKYTVTFSRYLNPSDTEDAAYLEGAPPAKKGESYFGIFFEIQNESDEPQKLPETLTIKDAEGNEYGRIPTESMFGLPISGDVEPEEQIPVLDSAAQQGPIQGSVVVFLLPEEASENRPLTLLIATPEGERGQVTLDL